MERRVVQATPVVEKRRQSLDGNDPREKVSPSSTSQQSKGQSSGTNNLFSRSSDSPSVDNRGSHESQSVRLSCCSCRVVCVLRSCCFVQISIIYIVVRDNI